MSELIPPPSSLPPGSVVWACLRDSGGAAQEKSVPQQRAEIEGFCKQYNLILEQVFADVAISGGSVVGRDAFNDLLDMSAKENLRPAGLLLWNFARFSRDLEDSIYYKALLRKRGIVIHSLTDPIPEGVYGRMVEMIVDISNEEKRRQVSSDTKRGLRDLFKQGFSFGIPPRGYIAEQEKTGERRDGLPRFASRWVPDPDLADVAKLAWAMRVDNKTYHELDKATGGKLYKSKNCWPTFFRNKAYLGIGVWGKLEVPDHHPALIDLATWEAVQRIQEETRRPYSGSKHPRRVGAPSLLSGLAICIHCGFAMSHDKAGKNKWPCYICGKKRMQGSQTCDGRMVNAKLADAAILDTVLNRVLTKDYIAVLLDETRSKLALPSLLEIEADTQNIQSQIAEVNRAIKNLLDLVETFGAQSAGERIRQQEAKQASLHYDLRQLEAKRELLNVEVTPEALDLVLAVWRGQIADARQEGDIRMLQHLLACFVEKVELGYNTARIWYTYPINALHGVGVLPVGGTLAYPWPCKVLVVEWR